MEENYPKNNYRITDLDSNERPRERLIHMGAQALSAAELIAILLRVGVKGENAVQVGQRLLQTFGGISGLQKANFEEVKSQHGIGTAKAAALKAAIELGRRLSLESPEERVRIHGPEDAFALVKYEMSALEQEHLRVMLLDTRNQVLEIIELYQGSLNSSTVRVAEVFRDAVRRNAGAILVVHNHPSGDPAPSQNDIDVTKAIVNAGNLLDINVLDHIVVGNGRFVSMKEQKLGFS